MVMLLGPERETERDEFEERGRREMGEIGREREREK